MPTTAFDIAQTLLNATPIDALRMGARRNQTWGKLFRGFRPQLLPRSRFVQEAPAYAQDFNLMSQLCDYFLDSHGAAKNADLRSRFADAIANKQLDMNVASICEALAKEELRDLLLTARSSSDVKETADLSEVASAGVEETAPEHSLPHSASADPSTTRFPADTGHAEELPTTEADQAEPMPDLLAQQVMLEWEAPQDQVAEAQDAVTTFERALVAFVQQQLESLYGPAWLRRGCGSVREVWRKRAEKAGNSSTVEPSTSLGYAELGELKDIIKATNNWPAFEARFESKPQLDNQFRDIISLRVSVFHSAQRNIYFIQHTNALSNMVKLADKFHPETARQIDAMELMSKGVEKAFAQAGEGVSFQR